MDNVSGMTGNLNACELLPANIEVAMQAKFKCIEKTQTTDGHRVLLTPVVSGSEENKKYFKYTPYGEIKMGTINDAAAEKMIVGKEYYISFTPAS